MEGNKVKGGRCVLVFYASRITHHDIICHLEFGGFAGIFLANNARVAEWQTRQT